MKSRVAVVLLLILAQASYAKEAPLNMTRFNVVCPAKKLLPELDAAYHECNNGYENGSCALFVSIFDKLLPEYDCQRPFEAKSNYIAPAIWLAGAAHEDYVRLLSKLKDSRARCLFGSSRFRATLDGDLAETYSDRSHKVGRSLGHTCNGA